jgi:hypothetical protein
MKSETPLSSHIPSAPQDASVTSTGPRSRAPSRLRKDSQAAQKGPDARRRPRAAREAYSLYVERAAEGANLLGGGFAPFRHLPPGLVAPAKPALGSGILPRGRPTSEALRPLFGVPLRARASPAPRTGGRIRRGPSRPPPTERRRWAFFSSLLAGHRGRSRPRYWMASATCSAAMSSDPARSAIVRATLRMRS